MIRLVWAKAEIGLKKTFVIFIICACSLCIWCLIRFTCFKFQKWSLMHFHISYNLQIHVTISISNLIILPVNIIWKKCTYLFEGSNLPIPHLGTLHGPGSLPGWTFVQLDFDINVYKCKCCKLRTSIKKRARGQIIFMHININQWRNL